MYHRECAFPLTVVFSPADLLCGQPIFGTYTRPVPTEIGCSMQIVSETKEIGFFPADFLFDQRDWFFSLQIVSLRPARLVFCQQIVSVTSEIGF